MAKSLDLPYDEMRDVNVQKGVGALGLLGIAATAGLPGAILGGIMLWNQLKGDDASTPAAPVDTEYDVRFYDADGNPIKVPHVSEREPGE